MTEKDFIPGKAGTLPENGTTSWQAPSNIALVKYWGKRPGQLPTNPSVSFTLDTSATRTTVKYRRVATPSGVPTFRIYLDGVEAPHFADKITHFLNVSAFISHFSGPMIWRYRRKTPFRIAVELPLLPVVWRRFPCV